MSEIVNQFSDWMSAYLPQIIAIVTSSTFVFILARFIFNLILLKVKAKTTKNLNDEVVKKYTALEEKVNQVVIDLQVLFSASMEKYAEMTKEQFNVMAEQYKNSKIEYLNAVINGQEETKKLIEDAIELKQNLQEAIETSIEEEKQEIAEKIEEIETHEEEIERIKEPRRLVEDEEDEEKVVEMQQKDEEEKYIVVKKVYGE